MRGRSRGTEGADLTVDQLYARHSATLCLGLQTCELFYFYFFSVTRQTLTHEQTLIFADRFVIIIMGYMVFEVFNQNDNLL